MPINLRQSLTCVLALVCKATAGLEHRLLSLSICVTANAKLHLCRYFCGPNAMKTAAQAKQQKKRPRKGENAKSIAKSKTAKTEEDAGPSNAKTKGKAGKKDAAGPLKKTAAKGRRGKVTAKGRRKQVHAP